MSHRIEPPAVGVDTMPTAASECLTAIVEEPATEAARRPGLTTAAGLVSATASAWHVRLVPTLGVVSPQGEVRRTWSRGPRR